MAQKRLRNRIREVLNKAPEGATAKEIGGLIADKYNTEVKSAKKIGAVCAHDPTVTTVGKLKGDNLYALKPKVRDNEKENLE